MRKRSVFKARKPVSSGQRRRQVLKKVLKKVQLRRQTFQSADMPVDMAQAC
ncbi:hypothetical protein GCM10009092_34690 [Bowmanella denitrificans]|mgnify:CR=1 FL=1|uniref:Uncharacterized protein n=1 Tax=Bowmanella denitrificans TaxID=366582 RepID=A0ABN0XLN5_9ALTE|nr:hypothetical protein [Bowmanella denitrificans]